MKGLMIFTLASAVVGTQASICHHFKARLTTFDEENCRGLFKGKQQTMSQDQCYNFDDFRSYQVESHHGDSQTDRNCTVAVFETPNCSGRTLNYGDVRDHPNACGNAVFRVGPNAKHSGRSAKLHCEARPKKSSSVKTVTVASTASASPSVLTVTQKTTDHDVLIAPPQTEWATKVFTKKQTVTVSPSSTSTPSRHTLVRVEPVTKTTVIADAPVEIIHSTTTVMYTPSTTRVMTFVKTWTASDAFKEHEVARPTRRSTDEMAEAEAEDKCSEEVGNDDEQ